MTDRPLSPQDLEILSAYLDNQLAAGEVKRLETRLVENDGLRATLDDLKHTRHMLRALPKMRAPRNFTLSAQMAGEIRQPRRSFWQLGSSWVMVSAVAVMLLMVTLMGDVMGVFTPAPMLAANDASQASELAVEMESMTDETAPAAFSAMALPETPTPEAEGSQAALETFTVIERDTVTPDLVLTPDPNARTMGTPFGEEAAGSEASVEVVEEMLAKEAPPTPLFTPPWVRVFETVLAGLAVTAVVLAVFLRRNF